jgi:hypothetical protein
MKTRQAMTTNPELMHKRITQLCQYLNHNQIYNYQIVTDHLSIARWHFQIMIQSGIVWKEDGKWRAAERLTQQRLDKFVQLCKEYQSKYYSNKKQIGQIKIKFPKTSHQVTQQDSPPVAKKTRQLRKVSLIKRIKFLFTGQL